MSLISDELTGRNFSFFISSRDNPAERLGYLRGGLKDIKTHRYVGQMYAGQVVIVSLYLLTLGCEYGK